MNALNFSGGPGALPESVLVETQRAIELVPETGLSLLGISHRSDWFAAVLDEAETNIRALLDLPDDYHVLFLQGGATLQFSMIPMLLLRGRKQTAEYLRTGYWSSKAIPEAAREGQVKVIWDGAGTGFQRLPNDGELAFSDEAAYLHYVSNETVEGLQFHRIIGREDVPRVCDMSSDFLSGPCDTRHFGLIYAHAQKNLGPAGVTVAILRKDLLDNAPEDLHAALDYRNHIHAGSVYNTPPVFAIYVVLLVTRWLMREVGGLARMAQINGAKAERLYALIDASDGFYRGRADRLDRSLMNVVFNLPSAAIEAEFLELARSAGFHGLPGHRSLGGVRASIYNALSLDAVDALCEFMDGFRRKHR
jgi:phosphoserine aminotransferase